MPGPCPASTRPTPVPRRTSIYENSGLHVLRSPGFTGQTDGQGVMMTRSVRSQSHDSSSFSWFG